MKTKQTTPAASAERQGETVGRTYKTSHHGVHSRRIGGSPDWLGASRFKTKAAALDHLRTIGRPILGGMVSFGEGKDLFEYRIVRIDSVCTVEHVEERLV